MIPPNKKLSKKEKQVQEALGLYRQCQALNSQGHQCKHQALAVPRPYHGSRTLYEHTNAPTWVILYLCAEHSIGVVNSKQG